MLADMALDKAKHEGRDVARNLGVSTPPCVVGCPRRRTPGNLLLRHGFSALVPNGFHSVPPTPRLNHSESPAHGAPFRALVDFDESTSATGHACSAYAAVI